MAIRSERASAAPEHHPTQSGNPESNSTDRLTGSSTRRSSARQRRRSRLRHLLVIGTATLSLSALTGCSMITNAYKQLKRHECLDEFMISHRNNVFAKRAWLRVKHCYHNHQNLNEFRAGFMQGYIDIANGGDGCLPCTAPSQYWGWRYQSPGGQAAIDAYFSGYPLGVKAAEEDGVGHWGQMRHMGAVQPAYDPNAPTTAPRTNTPEGVPLGPDGQPMMEEIIVPGSERVVPTPAEPEVLELEMTPDIESIAPPVPELIDPVPEAIIPPAADEAAVEIPTTDLFGGIELEAPEVTIPPKVASLSAEDAATGPQANADDGADRLVPKQPTETYSLNDTTDLPTSGPAADELSDDLDDAAIEGIFGSIEIAKQPEAVEPTFENSTGETFSLGDLDEPVETAQKAEDAIPFKFE